MNSVPHFVALCFFERRKRLFSPSSSYISLKWAPLHMHVSKNAHTLSHSAFHKHSQPHFPNNHALNSHSSLCFLLVERRFFSLSLFVLNRGGKKKGRAKEARVMGELDGGKEEIKLRRGRRGRHSCFSSGNM